MDVGLIRHLVVVLAVVDDAVDKAADIEDSVASHQILGCDFLLLLLLLLDVGFHER